MTVAFSDLIQEREREELKAKQAEREMAKMGEERRRQTLRMVEDEVRKGLAGPVKEGEYVGMEQIDTEDENDEVIRLLLFFYPAPCPPTPCPLCPLLPAPSIPCPSR